MVPIVPVVLLGRNQICQRMLEDFDFHCGCSLGGDLHRWIAMEYNELPSSIIVTDFLLLDLGCTTRPSDMEDGWGDVFRYRSHQSLFPSFFGLERSL